MENFIIKFFVCLSASFPEGVRARAVGRETNRGDKAL